MGLSVISGITCGADVHILQQAQSNNSAASEFHFRAPSN